ncbi:hypothetical protein EWM64_g5344 [Hericium alpestre]|uniref:Uncharacterized protein n=1 Tax=Hericium alpestre TaxID=135208 RepID=A0A4Y9ZV44_9AGAM|nr:hypothetical protein EWM64_g5344 [Hericium alpestre]
MHRYHDPALDYISDLDFDTSHPNIATTDPFDPFPASPFPATPSYADSYQNSPYSGASDIHDFDQKHDALGLFSDSDPLVISRDEYSRDEYDPAAYDAPSSGGGLLMFDNDFMTNIDGPNVSLSVTPADDPSPAHSPAMYDHSSPASSAGRADSPASSVSSHPHSWRLPSH